MISLICPNREDPRGEDSAHFSEVQRLLSDLLFVLFSFCHLVTPSLLRLESPPAWWGAVWNCAVAVRNARGDSSLL
jgi:hypothetical protein